MATEDRDPVLTAAQTLVNEAYSLKTILNETREDVRKLVEWAARVDVRMESGQRRMDDYEVRIRKQESLGLKLSGVWSAVVVVGAVIAGSAGLVISAVALFQ